jgi:hypothetical protein
LCVELGQVTGAVVGVRAAEQIRIVVSVDDGDRLPAAVAKDAASGDRVDAIGPTHLVRRVAGGQGDRRAGGRGSFTETGRGEYLQGQPGRKHRENHALFETLEPGSEAAVIALRERAADALAGGHEANLLGRKVGRVRLGRRAEIAVRVGCGSSTR